MQIKLRRKHDLKRLRISIKLPQISYINHVDFENSFPLKNELNVEFRYITGITPFETNFRPPLKLPVSVSTLFIQNAHISLNFIQNLTELPP